MMSRFLWVFALFVIVGAHKDDKRRENMKVFVDELTRQMNEALQISLGSYYEDFRDDSYPYPTKPCTSGKCQSTTSSPVVRTESTADHRPTRKPTESSTKSPTESSFKDDSIRVGSLKGVPGHNFPDYTDIPLTSFTCADKSYLPGFYADLDTGCQVFHVCWPHRRESFLCPVGTTFNQALLACDYWYSSNCSLAPHYYDVNGFSFNSDAHEEKDHKASMIDVLLKTGRDSTDPSYKTVPKSDSEAAFVSQFLPVKAKVTVYSATADTSSKIVATASVGSSKKYDQKQNDHAYPKKPEDKPKHPDYISESKINLDPHNPQKPENTVIIRTINVEEATKYFMDRANQMMENFIKLLNSGPCPEVTREEAGKQTGSEKSLTSLNPRFIVKPVFISGDKTEKVPRSSKQAVPESASKATIKPPVTASSKEPTATKQTRPKLNILPMTKKALVENYHRFMKNRKA